MLHQARPDATFVHDADGIPKSPLTSHVQPSEPPERNELGHSSSLAIPPVLVPCSELHPIERFLFRRRLSTVLFNKPVNPVWS